MPLDVEAASALHSDAHRVEPILVQRSLSRPPRPALRITFRKYHIADCETVYEVSEHVDLAALEPVPW